MSKLKKNIKIPLSCPELGFIQNQIICLNFVTIVTIFFHPYKKIPILTSI